MLATYGSALIIIVASLYVGRAFFALLGKCETNWLETPVGLAILLVVCSVPVSYTHLTLPTILRV